MTKSRKIGLSKQLAHVGRLRKVLQHIELRLGDSLDLHSLAQVASLSPYHFHRLFKEHMGESIGAYVRRRRISAAATHLAWMPQTPILQIALMVGFGSSEAFTRAFKLQVGSTPSSWRGRYIKARQQNSKQGQVIGNFDQAALRQSDNDSNSSDLRLGSECVVNLVQRKAVSVAYLRHVGPYGQDVSCFNRTIVYPWLAANKLLGRPSYGISHDDPLVVDPSHCRYDACVEVPDDFVPGADAKRAVIPGGLYAVSGFEGNVNEITHFWTFLLTDWLPQSGHFIDERPCFEYYAPEFGKCDDARTFRCDICIPVVPESRRHAN